MRFRHKFSELRYAVQNKYNRLLSRRIARGEEENNAIIVYVKDLREDVGRLVISNILQTLLEAQHKASDMKLWIHNGFMK